MRFKVDSLQLKVKPRNRAGREGEAQLRSRQRRVGVKADSEESEDPRSVPNPEVSGQVPKYRERPRFGKTANRGAPRGWSCQFRFVG
jgi:hypothetical protein